MRVLFDVSHPAHVQFMTPIGRLLQERGFEIRFAGRSKDTTEELLRDSGFTFSTVSRAATRRTYVTDARELAQRTLALRTIIRRWNPQVVLTRNPSGILAGFRSGTWTVFDTDDGKAAGLHYRLAAPFADVVTSSTHDPEGHGSRHLRYPALKAHAFLHPDRFRAAGAARAEVGLGDDEPLHVVRWSRHDASHDRGIKGMTAEGRAQVVARLRTRGAVLESAEGEPPRLLTDAGARDVSPSRFLDLLATAEVCVTDGQSVASEAAVLGIPTLRLSGFTGRVWYLTMLEERGLVTNFTAGEDDELLTALAGVLDQQCVAQRRTRAAAAALNAASTDLAAWFASLLSQLASTPRSNGTGELVIPEVVVQPMR